MLVPKKPELGTMQWRRDGFPYNIDAGVSVIIKGLRVAACSFFSISSSLGITIFIVFLHYVFSISLELYTTVDSFSHLPSRLHLSFVKSGSRATALVLNYVTHVHFPSVSITCVCVYEYLYVCMIPHTTFKISIVCTQSILLDFFPLQFVGNISPIIRSIFFKMMVRLEKVQIFKNRPSHSVDKLPASAL